MNVENKVYVFSLCSPDARYQKHKSWYLKVTTETKYIINEFFDMLVNMLHVKFGFNPHYFDQKTNKPKFDMAILFHPSVLGNQWVSCANDFINKYGVVYIGYNGQMFPPINGKYIIHSEISSPVLKLPIVDIDELIYILMWKGGNHFYLKSSINRIFSKVKYNSFNEAYEEASKYVDKRKIKNSIS